MFDEKGGRNNVCLMVLVKWMLTSLRCHCDENCIFKYVFGLCIGMYCIWWFNFYFNYLLAGHIRGGCVSCWFFFAVLLLPTVIQNRLTEDHALANS